MDEGAGRRKNMDAARRARKNICEGVTNLGEGVEEVGEAHGAAAVLGPGGVDGPEPPRVQPAPPRARQEERVEGRRRRQRRARNAHAAPTKLRSGEEEEEKVNKEEGLNKARTGEHSPQQPG